MRLILALAAGAAAAVATYALLGNELAAALSFFISLLLAFASSGEKREEEVDVLYEQWLQDLLTNQRLEERRLERQREE